MPENWRQPEIRIVIYDKSQESTAKHLSDGDGGGGRRHVWSYMHNTDQGAQFGNVLAQLKNILLV